MTHKRLIFKTENEIQISYIYHAGFVSIYKNNVTKDIHFAQSAYHS